MDINEIPIRPTADLLMVYLFDKVEDTAVGGAIARELQDRGIKVSNVVASVREFVATWAAFHEDKENDNV